MKLIFILATLATTISANIINSNTTNHNNSELEFVINHNITTTPVIATKTTTNKMILKCNRFNNAVRINSYTDIWKKGFELEEFSPPRVKTHIFTDKKRFENSRCCSVVIIKGSFSFVMYRGLLLDISVYNDVSRHGESVTYYNGRIRSKGKNANIICLKRLKKNHFVYVINCCKTLDPESLTGCNFFNIKTLPYNSLHGRCLMLVESPLSIPGSTDMIYKPDIVKTPFVTTDSPATDTIKTPFTIINLLDASASATTKAPTVSTNKNFIIKVVLITSGLIITSIIVVTCYKKLTKKKIHVILKEYDEEEYL